MDRILNSAIEYLRDQTGDVTAELLLIEVDWGEQTPPVTDETTEVEFQGVPWRLVFSDSELVQRRALCGAPGGRLIAVYPRKAGARLPADFQGRAHGNRPVRLGLRYRLAAMTERTWPAEVDYDEWQPAVARYFDALVRAAGHARTLWAISVQELQQMLLEAAFETKIEEGKGAQLLAQLVALQRKTASPPGQLELSLLRAQLRAQQLGLAPSAADILSWVAEVPGRADDVVRGGLEMAAEQSAGLDPNWGNLNQLRALLINQRQFPENEARAGVIEIATKALPHVRLALRKQIIQDAEKDLQDVLPPGSYNLWFPSLLKQEIQRLAARLAVGDQKVVGGLVSLREHLYADQYRDQLDALDDMARLTGEWQNATAVGTFDTVRDWATWYSEVGGKIDLTALKLIRQAERETSLREPVETLLKAYWGWRSTLNLSFAKTYLAQYEGALHDRASGIFGTHRIINWVVQPLLKNHRRVLLIVTDGMAYPDFWHLTEQLAQASAPVYPGTGGPIAALALLPSVTSVSRRGLFLSDLPTDRLDDEETYNEKARTSESQALARALKDYQVRLYNKSALDLGLQQLLQDLDDRLVNLVAVILNAIDDQVKSPAGSVLLPTLDDLVYLKSIVSRALQAEWQVVLTADHGHTWHLGKEKRRGETLTGGGERFNPFVSTNSVPQDGLTTEDPLIVRNPETQKLVMLTATGTYYGQNPHRGYHGGVSLEEVVIPCVFLTDQPAATLRPSAAPQARVKAETEASEPAQEAPGIVLTDPDGRLRRVELPITLSSLEIRFLQALARLGEASEAQLKQALATRRVEGPLAGLREKLASVGLDYIEQVQAAGPEGAVYRLRWELLPK